jgi:hypothetical protein
LVSGSGVFKSPGGWAWYFHHPDWYTANRSVVDPLAAFTDNVTSYYTTKFGYSLSTPNPSSSTGEWIVEVSDEGLGVGGAAGAEGLGITGGAVLDDFFSKSFVSHELANVFQGQVTSGWPWANGSNVWRALNPADSPYTSPFPYAASVMALTDLGFTDIAQRKVQDDQADFGFQLLYAVFNKFGWAPFASLMLGIKELNISLANYAEPTKTGIVTAVISWKSRLDFVTTFNEFFATAGVEIAQSVFDQITGLFPAINLTGLLPTGISAPT